MIVEQGVLTPEFGPAPSVGDAVARARTGAGLAWISLLDPDDAELEAVLDALGQDRPARLVADRRSGHAGFIGSRDHLFVTLVEADRGSGGGLAPIALEAVVGRDHLVVVQRAGDAGSSAGLRRRTQEQLADLVEDGPPSPWVALAALLFVHFDDYDRSLRVIEDAVESLNDRLFPTPDDTVLEDAYRTDQSIMRIGRAVRPIAHGLAEAAADDRLGGNTDVRRAVAQLRAATEDLVERVTWAEQTVASLVSTMLGLTSQRTNELTVRQAAVAQRISAYALLFAIPNALFALYGTNFTHLPAILTAAYGYPVLLATTVVLMAVTAWRLHRSGWL
jgi:magnesium transporter